MTTTWAIPSMKRLTDDGVVVQATYIFQAQEQNFINRKVGDMTFSGSVDEPGFIPYDQLTQDDVLGWVFTELGDQKAAIEAEITLATETQYSSSIANPYSNGVPWNSQPQG